MNSMMSTMTSAPLDILIAEDSPTQARHLQHILENRGYSVTVGANGRLALDAALRRKPALLISDVVMPEMDGYELCCQIKQHPTLRDTPVILVTTLSDPHDVIRGLECGADQFILKPYDEGHLLDRVQFMLLNREMRRVDQPGMGIEISFNGQKHYITADRLQILTLLMSTYEAAVQRNNELRATQETLQQTNGELQQLTLDLEDRVLQRTRDLEDANIELRHSQHRFQTLTESLPQLVWTSTPEGRCDYLSRQWEDYTGLTAEEQLGHGWMEQLHPDDTQRVRSAWAQALLRGQFFDNEFRIRSASGVYRWFKSRALPLRDTTGRISKWFGSNTDFEDSKRAQEELQVQVLRRDLLNRIAQAIAERQDLQSVFQAVVVRLEEQLPVDLACVYLYDTTTERFRLSCAGNHARQLVPSIHSLGAADIELARGALTRCVEGTLVSEPDISHLSTSPFPLFAHSGLRALIVAPIRVSSKLFGALVVARRAVNSFSDDEREFLRQLSEHVALAAHQTQLNEALRSAYEDLRRTQQAVMQQERLRALGQMASGIAHDINNAISPIALYTELLMEREVGLSAQGRNQLTTINRAINDVAQTVLRMREFYRPRESETAPAAVDINRLITQVLDLTRARWNDQPQQRGIMIELESDLSTGLPLVGGSESEIRDALTNLIFNAVDAMPRGGVLSIRTRELTQQPGSVAKRVSLEVEDTGVGMDEATQRRCLEPFFTTKGERGTGLGLAMVYGMTQRHGIELSLDSEIGQGTTVRLNFPSQATAVTTDSGTATSYSPDSSLRILLVDDDALLLESLQETLQADGHDVTAANGGQAGIDAFMAAQQRGEPFDIVITDLGMPYVDGRKVASNIRAAAPHTPIILLTGWGQRLPGEEDRPQAVDELLSKPPRLQDLRSALVRCCASRRA
jgi:PAS domain S-box-containing protein